MVRSELVNKIAEEKPHLSPIAVEAAVNAVFKAIEDALARGQRVEVRGFGVFVASPRIAREGRNPKNGDPISIPQKRLPRFKGSALLHDRLNHKD